MRGRPIYVESLIDVDIDGLWDATQDPQRHQRWDVRFGSITYLPRSDNDPQQFTYATSVLPGVRVAGTGESLGDRDRPDGSRWSGLKFWADHPLSLIAAGAGYWKYVPAPAGGIRFITRFDYRTKWGRFGESVDRALFRPLFGWGTAWSFDRLRLWLEQGIAPERSRNRTLAHAAAVTGIAGVCLYQGVLLKLWRADPVLVNLWRKALGVSHCSARSAVRVAGLGEAAFGLLVLAKSDKKWTFGAAASAMPLLAVSAWLIDRRAFSGPINAVSLHWAVAALAAVALGNHDGRPSARTPRRVAPDRQPEVGELP